MDTSVHIVEYIKKMFPDANESSVIEAVISASLAETSYELILALAINLYLEHYENNGRTLMQNENQEQRQTAPTIPPSFSSSPSSASEITTPDPHLDCSSLKKPVSNLGLNTPATRPNSSSYLKPGSDLGLNTPAHRHTTSSYIKPGSDLGLTIPVHHPNSSSYIKAGSNLDLNTPANRPNSSSYLKQGSDLGLNTPAHRHTTSSYIKPGSDLGLNTPAHRHTTSSYIKPGSDFGLNTPAHRHTASSYIKPGSDFGLNTPAHRHTTSSYIKPGSNLGLTIPVHHPNSSSYIKAGSNLDLNTPANRPNSSSYLKQGSDLGLNTPAHRHTTSSYIKPGSDLGLNTPAHRHTTSSYIKPGSDFGLNTPAHRHTASSYIKPGSDFGLNTPAHRHTTSSYIKPGSDLGLTIPVHHPNSSSYIKAGSNLDLNTPANRPNSSSYLKQGSDLGLNTQVTRPTCKIIQRPDIADEKKAPEISFAFPETIAAKTPQRCVSFEQHTPVTGINITTPTANNTTAMATKGFHTSISGIPLYTASTDCTVTPGATSAPRPQSKYVADSKYTAGSAPLKVTSSAGISQKKPASTSSCRTEPAVTDTAPTTTHGFRRSAPDNQATSVQDNQATSVPDNQATSVPDNPATSVPDNQATSVPSNHVLIKSGTTYSDKRHHETCEIQSKQKRIKMEKPGSSSKTQLVCSPMDSVVETANMQECSKRICQACCKYCDANTSVKCNKSHTICRCCWNAEIYNVITTDKMHISCPVPSCNGEITLDAVLSLPRTVSIKFLKANIYEKQVAASLGTIKQLKGLVSCPRCPYAAQLSQEIKIFTCADSSCKVTCCRYCKAPWLESEERVHAGCSILEFSGSDCFNDISVLPDNWTDGGSQEFGDFSVRVPRNSEEGKRVCDFYSKTSRGVINKLTRIQNRALWEKYVLKRKHMKEEIGEEELREKFLFHGTGKQNIDKICREGFDFRKQGANGTMFGKGSYFSTTASYSETYSDGSNCLFLVRVLCGRSTKGHYGDAHPPYDTSGKMFDSCVDRPSKPTMYIVYAIEQCYPAYLIKYQV